MPKSIFIGLAGMMHAAVAPARSRADGGPSRRRHAAAAAAAAVALLALAASSVRRAPRGPVAVVGATQALWEGDPMHHVLPATRQQQVKEAWGMPLADFRYEPSHGLRLGVSLAAGRHANSTNSTRVPAARRQTADESRRAVEDYFSRIQAAEEAKLKPAHDEDMRVMYEEREKMTADEARKSVAELPGYAAWLRGEEQQEIKSAQDQTHRDRKVKNQFLQYDARAPPFPTRAAMRVRAVSLFRFTVAAAQAHLPVLGVVPVCCRQMYVPPRMRSALAIKTFAWMRMVQSTVSPQQGTLSAGHMLRLLLLRQPLRRRARRQLRQPRRRTRGRKRSMMSTTCQGTLNAPAYPSTLRISKSKRRRRFRKGALTGRDA